jgi:hypothetical protein
VIAAYVDRYHDRPHSGARLPQPRGGRPDLGRWPKPTKTCGLNRQPHRGAGQPLGAIGDQFSLEAVDERLGERVVVDVAGRANRGEHPVVGERLGVVDARAASLNQSLVSFKYGLPSHSFSRG